MAAITKRDPAISNPLLRLKLRTRLATSVKWIVARPEERSGCRAIARCGGTFSFQSSIPFKSPISSIYIRKPRFDDSHMESLKHCKSLVLVDIGDTNVTERGVKCLSECKALEVLALWGTEVTDRIADVLSEFVPLYVLNLTDTKISVDAINEIATMFPETYIFNRTYGDRFRGLIGREAMHAWMQDDDQNDAFKPDLRGFPDG